MLKLKSLASERFRTIFLIFYSSSVLLPILIMLLLILQYVKPVLTYHQINQLSNVFTYGLAAMVAVPLLGFLLITYWINSLEALTESMKSRAAKVLNERIIVSDNNEIVTLHRHFDGLFGELEGKIDQINRVSKELELSKKKLTQMAVTDELTTLFNRRYFDRRLLEEIKKAQKRKSSLALIMIDVDGFRKYNENFGHQAGDALLRSLGLLIRDFTRKPDVPFRYGGDEFGIILPEASIEDAAAKAQKLTDAAARLTIKGTIKGKPSTASISSGVISYTRGLEGLLLEADRCLNQAIAAGKGSVVCLTPKPRG